MPMGTLVYSHYFDAFTQFKFSYDKIDFYLAQSSLVRTQREGMYKNGIYETISFGKRKVPLRILVLKAEFYLKFQVAIIEFQRIAFV
jgi:hypothetical protein